VLGGGGMVSSSEVPDVRPIWEPVVMPFLV
jgi:hypothetical protein